MLNKQICKKCFGEWFPNAGAWNGGNVFCWDENGIVYCAVLQGWVKIEDGPCKGCCYLVEQFLHHDATEKIQAKC